jgi:hypothetical protein
LNGFCNSFNNAIHFVEKIVGHHWFAVHEIWGYLLEEEHILSEGALMKVLKSL